MAAYIIELPILTFILVHNTAAIMELWDFILLVAVAGLVAGFLINAFANFRRPVLFYAIGHVIVVLSVIAYFKRVHFTSPHTGSSHTNFVAYGIDWTDEHQLDRIIGAFDKEYPDDLYEFSVIDLFPRDSTKASEERDCYIIFENTQNKKQFINKYFVAGDSVKMVFHNIPVPGQLYEDYLRKSEARKLQQKLIDSVNHLRVGS